MKDKHKEAVERYQCPGCVGGSNIECYEGVDDAIRCDAHCAGTNLIPGGRVFLGMPKGFNKLGPCGNELRIQIFDNFNEVPAFDFLNIPIWKYLDKDGNTMIKGMSPRIMSPFIYVVLENCVNGIRCYEVTEGNLENMD